jgi:hypothetical protein
MEILREKHNEVEKEARDKAAITMAINSLSYSFTITERVIPTLSATFEAINRPSLPPNSSKICSIACYWNGNTS